MTFRPEWRGGGGGGGGCDIRFEAVEGGGSDSEERGMGVDVLSKEITEVSESFRLGLGGGGFIIESVD
jgi:hypothetical protein